MFEKLRGVFRPIADFLAKYLTWLHPNAISIIGFFLSFIPVYFYIQGYPLHAGISLIVCFFDFLDGAVARLAKRVSLFGEVLDASLDRIVDGLIIFSIALGGFVNWYLAVVVFIGSYMVSYVRARTGEAAETKSIKLNVGFGQRGDRILLLMLASIFYFSDIRVPILNICTNTLGIIFVVLAILTWLTVLYRLYYAYVKLRKLEE